MRWTLLARCCALGVATAAGGAAQNPAGPPSAGFPPVPSETPPPAAPAAAPAAPPAAASAPLPPPAVPAPTAPPPAAPAPYASAPPPYYPYSPPAASAPAVVPPEPEPERHLTLSLSPLLLMFPMFELGAELGPIDGLGVSVHGGLGRWGVSLADQKKATYPAWRLGGQLAWYLMHPFSGLHLGADLSYLRVHTDDFEFPWDGLQLRRLSVGPLLGYKLVARVGFTFHAQFGIVRAFEKARAESAVLGDLTEEEARWDPLLNVGLGWSF